MKRAFNSLLFLLCGLISLYASLKISELMDFHKIFPARIYNGCWEMGHCLISSWYWCIVIFILLFPILTFFYFGFHLSDKRILHAEAAKKLITLFLATLIFQISGAAIFFFIKTM